MAEFSSSLLLIIDVQNDFCPGGTLAVTGGDEVIEPLNKLSRFFELKGGKCAATQDWHPEGHVSYSVWPNHCLKGSKGAEFHPSLELDQINLILRKGFRKDLDSYSAFYENDKITPTGLDSYVKSLSIDTVYIGGLATDYCVYYSALDAVKLRLKTYVINDAVRGVDIPEGNTVKAINEMKKQGIVFIESGDLLK